MTAQTTEQKPTRPKDWLEQRDLLSRLVGRRVAALQAQYCLAEPVASAKAALAQLRRAALTGGSSLVSVDAFAVDAHTHVPDECYPLNSQGRPVVFNDEPTHAEIAVHTAMTLYAVHQQSRRTDRMHRLGEHPGKAFGKLAHREGMSEAAVRRRFTVLVTAGSYAELLHHLRTTVRLLRDGNVPMDYGRLTADLFTWQSSRNRDRTRLSWSRDFEDNITFRPATDSKEDDQ